MRTLLLLATLASTLASCTPQECTEIGCRSGLTVRLEGRTGGAVFEVTGDIDGEPVSFRCDDTTNAWPHQCLVDSFILAKGTGGDIAVARLSVTEPATGRTWTGELRPVFKDVFPNGEDCGPACRQAQETATLAAP